MVIIPPQQLSKMTHILVSYKYGSNIWKQEAFPHSLFIHSASGSEESELFPFAVDAVGRGNHINRSASLPASRIF